SRGRAQEPHVPRQVEEPLVSREAHAGSREVPDHLGGLGSHARDRRGDRGSRRPRARALLHDEGADDGACQGRQGGAARGRERVGTSPGGARIVSIHVHGSHTLTPGGPHGSPGVFVYDAARVLLIAAVRSVLTYVAVSLYVLIVAPPAMLVAALFGAKE